MRLSDGNREVDDEMETEKLMKILVCAGKVVEEKDRESGKAIVVKEKDRESGKGER